VITTRLLCACALLFATFSAGAEDKNPAATIVGTWKVVTYQERPFEFVGDRLILRPKWTVDGKQWTGLRVFERAQ
jgi:hypothetical protein